jgi:hypothetical protein
MAKSQYSADSAYNPHSLLLSDIPTRDARLPSAGIDDAWACPNPPVVASANAAPPTATTPPAISATLNR